MLIDHGRRTRLPPAAETEAERGEFRAVPPPPFPFPREALKGQKMKIAKFVRKGGFRPKDPLHPPAIPVKLRGDGDRPDDYSYVLDC